MWYCFLFIPFIYSDAHSATSPLHSASYQYWTEFGDNPQSLVPKPRDLKNGLQFGYAVSVGDDMCAVSVRGTSQGGGRAYLFKANADRIWYDVGSQGIVSSATHDDQFGTSLSIHKGILAVGATKAYCNGWTSGAVYVYSNYDNYKSAHLICPIEYNGRNAGGSSNSYFGQTLGQVSVKFEANGQYSARQYENVLLIGGHGLAGGGKISVYTILSRALGIEFVKHLYPPSSSSSSSGGSGMFGYTFAMRGKTLAVSDPYFSQVHVYSLNATTKACPLDGWDDALFEYDTGHLYDQEETSCSHGAGYYSYFGFNRDVTLQDGSAINTYSDAGVFEGFGGTVAVFDDSVQRTVLVGNPGKGTVYVLHELNSDHIRHNWSPDGYDPHMLEELRRQKEEAERREKEEQEHQQHEQEREQHEQHHRRSLQGEHDREHQEEEISYRQVGEDWRLTLYSSAMDLTYDMWILETVISESGSSNFGIALAVYNETIIVGSTSEKAFIYSRKTIFNNWNQNDENSPVESGYLYNTELGRIFIATGKDASSVVSDSSVGSGDDKFGVSLALEGEVLVVGARRGYGSSKGKRQTGSAFVYDRLKVDEAVLVDDDTDDYNVVVDKEQSLSAVNIECEDLICSFHQQHIAIKVMMTFLGIAGLIAGVLAAFGGSAYSIYEIRQLVLGDANNSRRGHVRLNRFDLDSSTDVERRLGISELSTHSVRLDSVSK